MVAHAKPKAGKKEEEVLTSFAFNCPDGSTVSILATDQADAERRFHKLHPLSDGK